HQFMPDPIPQEYQVYDPTRNEIRVVVIQPPKHRYWLHALLLLATIFSTLCIGARMQYGFEHNIGLFSQDADIWPWLWIFEDWHRLGLGVAYSACVLGILGAHELGHYVFCVVRRVFATLPFFIPAPTLIGTLGAFIRIKSPLRSRADLFDIGIAGPIAGFVVALIVLIFSLGLSRVAPLGALPPDIQLGYPLIFHLVRRCLVGLGYAQGLAGVPLSRLYLHPVAIAAWVGMFATSLNLLPGGQLDGGHIVFSVSPGAHKK